MNIETSNGMGLKPTGMQLKASNGMGIKTGNGMGLKTSNGMGLASDDNYFKFDEYQRKREYLFGDRGQKKKPPPPPKTEPKEKPTPEEKPEDPPVEQQKTVTVLEPVPEATPTPLPPVTGNTVGSVKRMLHMFG
ncbi:uncharacterized protein LOC143276923 [Babylonia areolata]|uniref:uncharacterized protein LOC143276923 n=1 Tax=Babylonia areolata TaxID=304850 RepID=UPI003FD59D65